MAYGICVAVWGDRARFIDWHPGMRYTIDRIHVLNPIRFTNVRRNEVKSKALASTMRTAATGGGKLPYINTKDDIQQRASLILIDVRYVIEAHFDLTDKATPDDKAKARTWAVLLDALLRNTRVPGAFQSMRRGSVILRVLCRRKRT